MRRPARSPTFPIRIYAFVGSRTFYEIFVPVYFVKYARNIMTQADPQIDYLIQRYFAQKAMSSDGRQVWSPTKSPNAILAKYWPLFQQFSRNQIAIRA